MELVAIMAHAMSFTPGSKLIHLAANLTAPRNRVTIGEHVSPMVRSSYLRLLL